ncbi:MAG: RsmB/NOP family class I SAM-dependent RNA methyltransferase [Candidatus Magasanikbacteria bacterium]
MPKKKNKKSQSHGLPEVFLERLTRIVGLSYFEQIKRTFVERPTTFRVNTIKANRQEILEILQQQGFKVRQVQWYKDAFILLNKTKRELTDLDMYDEGKIYIQSLASMIPPLVLDPQPGDRVLDLTAAPGSKTSQIAAMMRKQGELVANDKNKIRFFKLKHNVEALGVAELALPLQGGARGGLDYKKTSSDIIDPSQPLLVGEESWKFNLRMEDGYHLCKEYPEYFDKIILDAPCSAETRFVETNIKTYGYWKENKIKEMVFAQRGLLFAAWSALKPGGTLVYSTCTFAPEENELQITRFLEKITNVEICNIDVIDIKKLFIVKEWKGRDIDKNVQKKALRIMPSNEIEGFFVVKLKKLVIHN